MNNENKLIAEFIGMQKTSIGWFDAEEVLKLSTIDNTFDNLQFHTSWDWLMPCVEKCVTTHEVQEGKDWDYHYSQLHDGLWAMNIEATYKAVVEFIKWYNENK